MEKKEVNMSVDSNESNLVEWSVYRSKYIENSGKTSIQIEMYQEAKDFLDSQKWCSEINCVYVGLMFPGIVAIFLIELNPASEETDDKVWVVVGDLPSAYITYEEDTAVPLEALRVYIDVMRDWIDAVRCGGDMNEVIPVDADATLNNADSLEEKLNFLNEKIISEGEGF